MAGNPIRDDVRQVVKLDLSAEEIQQGLLDAPVALANSKSAVEKAAAADTRSTNALNNSTNAVSLATTAKSNSQSALDKATSVEKRASEGAFNGKTPHIGANGNWFVGTTDTGVKAQGERGERGEPGGVTSVNGQTGAITNVVKDNTTDVVIGSGATNGSSDKSVVVIGAGATIPYHYNNDSNVCIGARATCQLARSIAVGRGARATDGYGVALGAISSAGQRGTAVGYDADAVKDAVAIGEGAKSNGDGSVAIVGRSDGVNSIAMQAQAAGGRAVSIGYNSYVMGDSSTALGAGAAVENVENTMQLGDNDLLSVLRSNVQLTVTSDERDKADIKEVSSALDFVKKLRPVTFVKNPRGKYISEENKKSDTFLKYGMCDYDKVAHAEGTLKGNRRRIGLLAQETQIALQEVYGTDNYADIVNDNFYDLVDKPKNVENKLTLAYSNLVPFLIGAIKEQQEQIDELKTIINSLKR